MSISIGRFMGIGRGMLGFLRGIQFLAFGASIFFLTILIIGVLTDDVPLYITLPIVLGCLVIAIFLTVWIPRRFKQIDAMLEDIRQNGHRTIAEFNGRMISGGGSGVGVAVPLGREIKSSFWVKYTDENGKRRRVLTHEVFTFEERRLRFELPGTFPVACRGRWVVMLDSNH